MFTGIITDIGEILEIDTTSADRTIKIRTSFDLNKVDIGASIACSGCCLSVVEKGSDWFSVQVSDETLSKTMIGSWEEGSRVNLEQSLKLGDELGGHMVAGHIDGLAIVEDIKEQGGSHVVSIRVPEDFAKFVAPKGSVALDGISLTVNDVRGSVFDVNIIPHTWSVTTFANIVVGQKIHFEVDLMARYVQRALETKAA